MKRAPRYQSTECSESYYQEELAIEAELFDVSKHDTLTVYRKVEITEWNAETKSHEKVGEEEIAWSFRWDAIARIESRCAFRPA